MTKGMDPVAKIRILVLGNGERRCLMSRKRAKGRSRHKKLEFLGGHLERGESPIQALIRELREEERTGTLATIVADRNPSFSTNDVDEAEHHLFELTISSEECDRLEADRRESLGFVRVSADDLESGALEEQLTHRTRLILEAFGPAPVDR